MIKDENRFDKELISDMVDELLYVNKYLNINDDERKKIKKSLKKLKKNTENGNFEKCYTSDFINSKIYGDSFDE